ncbi:Pre-mRNA-splicing factor CWC25, partial [Frankliniella fusca]
MKTAEQVYIALTLELCRADANLRPPPDLNPSEPDSHGRGRYGSRSRTRTCRPRTSRPDDDAAAGPSRAAGGGRHRGRARSAGTSDRTRTVGCSPLRAPGERPRRADKKDAAGAGADNDNDAPGVELASVVSFLEGLASEEPLCQLPDVHRIPAIQKWVRLRNGLLYVHRRLAEVLQDRSLIMWNANHLGMSYRVPTPKHGLTPKQVRELTWDRREWYRRRVDKIMSGYNQALRTIQVNAAREMFPAMACDYFPGRDKFIKTYFAYMPKHEMDQPVVKPWNPGEYNQSILPLWRDRYYQCRARNTALPAPVPRPPRSDSSTALDSTAPSGTCAPEATAAAAAASTSASAQRPEERPLASILEARETRTSA